MAEGPKRLYRSKDQRIVLGVCGGVAEYFNIDPTVVRIVLLIGSILTGFVTGIIVYAILAIIMPAEEDVDKHPTDAARSTVNEAVSGVKQAAGTASSWVGKQVKGNTEDDGNATGQEEAPLDHPDSDSSTDEGENDPSSNPAAADHETFETAVSATPVEDTSDSLEKKPEADTSPGTDQSSND